MLCQAEKIYYNILNLIVKLLVKSKAIPINPVNELGLDPAHPILYVLPYQSTTDLLTLRAQCLKRGLPDPLIPLESEGRQLPSYVCIDGRPRVLRSHASLRDRSRD